MYQDSYSYVQDKNSHLIFDNGELRADIKNFLTIPNDTGLSGATINYDAIKNGKISGHGKLILISNTPITATREELDALGKKLFPHDEIMLALLDQQTSREEAEAAADIPVITPVTNILCSAKRPNEIFASQSSLLNLSKTEHAANTGATGIQPKAGTSASPFRDMARHLREIFSSPRNKTITANEGADTASNAPSANTVVVPDTDAAHANTSLEETTATILARGIEDDTDLAQSTFHINTAPVAVHTTGTSTATRPAVDATTITNISSSAPHAGTSPARERIAAITGRTMRDAAPASRPSRSSVGTGTGTATTADLAQSTFHINTAPTAVHTTGTSTATRPAVDVAISSGTGRGILLNTNAAYIGTSPAAEDMAAGANAASAAPGIDYVCDTAEITPDLATESQVDLPALSTSLNGMINILSVNGMPSRNSENMTERFVIRVTSRLNNEDAARTLDGTARLTSTGAVPQMTMSVANSAASIVTTRTSLASPLQNSGGGAVALTHDGVQTEGLSAGDGLRSGFGMWLMPMYQNQSVFNLDSGNFTSGYASSFGGIVLGADYTFSDAFRLGMSFNAGVGHTRSSGDVNKTVNNFTYWGASTYAGYKYGNVGFSADVGHTSTMSRITQDIPSCLDMGKALTARNILSTNLSAGLRSEYKLKTGALDIIPHAGVRVNILHTWGFDVENAKRAVMEADDMDTTTIWQFPAGITFSKDITSDNGWTIKPQADLSVIPATGDLNMRQRTRMAGIPGSSAVDSLIMDSISGRASIGLEARHDNGFSVGMNYSFQGARHTSDHGVQATFRYDF